MNLIEIEILTLPDQRHYRAAAVVAQRSAANGYKPLKCCAMLSKNKMEC